MLSHRVTRRPPPSPSRSFGRSSALVVSHVTAALVGFLLARPPSAPPPPPCGALVKGGPYTGAPWRKPNATLHARSIVETPFARAELHTVRGEDGAVIKDWLWFDERDHVNVLARRAGPGGRFELFRQRKYAMARPTLAPVGGFIEHGESAADAAARELREELGLEAATLTPLGAFRTAANRGGGVLHAFFADGCYESAASRLPRADLEAQARVALPLGELRSALRAGEFQEVKWSATIALALLALDAADANGGAAPGTPSRARSRPPAGSVRVAKRE